MPVFRQPFRAPPGPRWIPTFSGGVTLVPFDPGQLTWTGQSVTASVDAAMSPGSLLWTGQDVTGVVTSVSLVYATSTRFDLVR